MLVQAVQKSWGVAIGLSREGESYSRKAINSIRISTGVFFRADIMSNIGLGDTNIDREKLFSFYFLVVIIIQIIKKGAKA